MIHLLIFKNIISLKTAGEHNSDTSILKNSDQLSAECMKSSIIVAMPSLDGVQSTVVSDIAPSRTSCFRELPPLSIEELDICRTINIVGMEYVGGLDKSDQWAPKAFDSSDFQQVYVPKEFDKQNTNSTITQSSDNDAYCLL